MIYIQEKGLGSDSIAIKVDGVLNYQSIQTLKDILVRNEKSQKQLVLQLAGITHIDRFGIDLLLKYRDKVLMKGLPGFLKMEIYPDGKTTIAEINTK